MLFANISLSESFFKYSVNNNWPRSCRLPRWIQCYLHSLKSVKLYERVFDVLWAVFICYFFFRYQYHIIIVKCFTNEAYHNTLNVIIKHHITHYFDNISSLSLSLSDELANNEFLHIIITFWSWLIAVLCIKYLFKCYWKVGDTNHDRYNLFARFFCKPARYSFREPSLNFCNRLLLDAWI